jgi:hypothetical protein
MATLLLVGGICFVLVGLYFLKNAGFSEEARYSWRMGLFAGGIAWVGFYLALRDGYAFLRFSDSGAFSVILAITGFTFLMWNKTASMIFYRFQQPFFQLLFGHLLEPINHWLLRAFRAAFLFAGLCLLLAAYANYFGPIELWFP